MISHFRMVLQKLLLLYSDERGASLSEYALLLLFIALVAVGSVTLAGGAIQGLYQSAVDLWP